MRKILLFVAGSLIMTFAVCSPMIFNHVKVAHAFQYCDNGTDDSGNSCSCPDGSGYCDGNGNGVDGGQNPVGTEGGQNPSSPKLQNPLSVGSDICTVLIAILNIVVRIGSIIAVLLIIWCGYKFIEAQGNPTKLTSAKKAFMWTIVGTAVLLGSSVIANVVVNTVFSVTNQQTGTTICNI